MAKVLVVRKGIQNGIRPYQVDIDGATYGALRTKGQLQVDIPPGRHTIVIGLDSAATFDNSDGKDTYVEFKASKWNNKANISISR
jgi:hypothetical protein